MFVVLYGYETWPFTLREECTLSVWQKRVPKRILRPKRDGVAGDWRKLHNEELNGSYSPNNIRVMKSRRMSWEGFVAHVGKRRGAHRVLVGKPEKTTWKTQT